MTAVIRNVGAILKTSELTDKKSENNYSIIKGGFYYE